MFGKKAFTTMVALMLLISSVGAFGGMVSAGGTLYVGTTGTNDAVTYSSIQDAVNNASSGDTIEVASGTYNTTVDVTTNNVTINVYNSSNGDVVINASGEEYGEAFYGEYDHNLTLGTNVQVTEDVVYVGTSNTDGNYTYTTIQNAINDTGSNTTISIAPGEYNESLNITSKNVGFINYNVSADTDVVINATNTTSGDAFRGEYNSSVRVGQYITVKEETYAGGGSLGDLATNEFAGIPYWAIALVAFVVGFLYYENE